MKILAVGAHLDDIEILCGGTLAKAIKQGHQVKAVIMTKSGYSDSKGNLIRADQTAINEGFNALNTLGIKDIQIIGLPNKYIEFNADTIMPLDNIVEEYDPDVIFTHHPFDTHQDHVNTGKSTVSACRRKNTILFYEPLYPSGRSYVPFKPQVYVDISETIEDKITALRNHKSEYEKFGAESWIHAIRNRAEFRGFEIGKECAESFELLRAEVCF